MKNLKKWIILLVIIFAIIIGIIVYVVHKNSGLIIYGIDEQPIESTYVYDATVKEVSVRNEYYFVKRIINKFYLNYNYIYNLEDDYLIQEEDSIEIIKEQKNEYMKAVYNMLDEEYITYKDITIENLTTKLTEIGKMSIIIDHMYVSEKDESISVYFAYGKLLDISEAQSYDFSIMVKVDMINKTFKVLLGDFISAKYGDLAPGSNIEINYPEKIEDNGYNKYDYEIIDDQTYIGDLFDSLRDNLIYNKQVAYENLDEEYRAKRFPTFEDFEKYIKDNRRKISVMTLDSYEKNNDNGNVQYICVDTNGKYYIINEKTTMNCTFILDTYTIDLPQFTYKYNNSENNVKVGLNIEKIREALNAKDFKYVYNKMDETFRNNNFSNYMDFENYLKSKLFEYNIFEYKKIEEKGNVYITTVIIKNAKNTKEESKEMEIIMKLENKTNYYISFNLTK